MKDDLKRQFELAAAAHEKNLKDAEIERDNKLSEAEKFAADWEAAASQIVVPALKEVVTEIFEPHGWTAQVRNLPPGPASKPSLQAYKGEMRGMGGSEARPELTFSTETYSKDVQAHAKTSSQAGSIGKITLQELNPDWVQSMALKFFKQMTGT